MQQGIEKITVADENWNIEWVYVEHVDKVMYVVISEREYNGTPLWNAGFHWGEYVEEDLIIYAKRLIEETNSFLPKGS